MGKPVHYGSNALTIHDLPVSERPRERLQRLGVEFLSMPEILTVILGRGIAGESVMITAQRLLRQLGGLKRISHAFLEELSGVRGIGIAKAAQIKAAVELANRVEGYLEASARFSVKTLEDVAILVTGRLKGKKRGYFLVVLLDTRNQLKKIAEIPVGSLESSVVHPREVFKEAIAASAAAVIFVHNHPSGDTEASGDDIQLTGCLTEAGEIVGIDVIDRIIIGGTAFRSLKGEVFLITLRKRALLSY